MNERNIIKTQKNWTLRLVKQTKAIGEVMWNFLPEHLLPMFMTSCRQILPIIWSDIQK